MSKKPKLFLFSVLPIFFLAYPNSALTQDMKNRKQNQDPISMKWSPADSMDFEAIKEFANGQKIENLKIGDLALHFAQYFLDTPYQAKTLEINEKERLVVNFQKMDCTTLVENVTALVNCTKKIQLDVESFERELARLRYRNGILNGYPSRLHYFSDWLHDNAQKGILEIVSNYFADEIIKFELNWMSNHPESYHQLGDKSLLNKIRDQEKMISGRTFGFIPKTDIDNIATFIHNGDLIAITTDIEGLDIAHVGLAAFKEGQLHMLHASSTFEKVVITEKSLQEYLSGQSRNTGIIVARLK